MEITPAPTDEEAAAVVAAIEVAWPSPPPDGTRRGPNRWRFSGRWWAQPIPLRRNRPW